MIKSFIDLENRAKSMEAKTRIAVIAAHDRNCIEAVSNARKDGIADAALIGDAEEIRKLLGSVGDSGDNYEIVSASDTAQAVAIAAAYVRDNRAGAIMKGKLETADMMRGILDKSNGLRTGLCLSTAALFETRAYHKLLCVTDPAIIPYPDVQTKEKMLRNASNLMRALGVEIPKAALLAAAERVDPKLPETVDADLIAKKVESGEISGCIAAGPISFDLATDPMAARIKNYKNSVAGDADILLAPNLVTANAIAKCLTGMAGAMTAGLVLGAKVPIILISRAASSQDKYDSIALAAVIAPSYQAMIQ